MDPALLVKTALVGSIALIVFSVGLGTAPGTLARFLSDPRPAARAMLAMFVAMPLFVLLISVLLPVKPAVVAALAALSISPMPPILPRKEQKAGASLDYALGIQVSATFLSLIAAPLWIRVFEQIVGRDLPFSAGAMLQTLLMTVIVPLTLGIAVNRFAPAIARKLEEPLAKIAMIILLVGAVLMMWKLGPALWHTLGGGSLAIMVAVALFGLGIGYLLGGPHEGNRGALALATSSRHPGVAIGVATAIFAGIDTEVVGAILLYFLVSAIIGLPLVRWAQKKTPGGA